MKREQYDEYLRRFNARDYDGLLEYFAEDFEVSFAGYVLRGRQAVIDFYSFLHQYIDERIEIHRYVSDANTIAMEADVKLKGIKELTPEILASKGLDRIIGLKPGQEHTIPQFIHYHLENGKFVKALCAAFEAPTE